MKIGIITASDKGAAGMREDVSGQVIKTMVLAEGYEVKHYLVVPDDRAKISETLVAFAKEVDLILTTGGTGFSPRDWTPEATRDVIHREVPGIAEAMRSESLKITKNAMLSRGIAGIRDRCLIVNLPGSPKAVKENLAFVLPSLRHGLKVLRGEVDECARG